MRPSFEKKNLLIDRRQKFFFLRQAEQAQNSRRARQRLQAGALIKVEQARQDGDAARVRQQARETQNRAPAREKNGRSIILLDLRARGFHQLAVFDARGARRLAGAAIQALIDMLHEGIAERQAALIHQHDLANSPAGRIGFEAPEFVCRAMIQAQAAVNAVRVVVIRGDVRAGKSALRFWAGSLFHGCGLIGHGLRSRPRNVPEPGHFAGRKNVSRGASTQNPDAAGPTRSPRTFLFP